MATVIAAALRVVVKRTPVVKPDQGGHELVDVFELTVGPAEELLPVKERVAATTEAALQFGDDSVDIVVGLDVQSSTAISALIFEENFSILVARFISEQSRPSTRPGRENGCACRSVLSPSDQALLKPGSLSGLA